MFVGLELSLRAAALLGSAVSAYAAYAFAADFDDQEYWSGGTKAASLSALPGYSFTRTGEQGAVDSTGAVSYFAANVPAINDLGYHVYGALTNEVIYSQTLTSASLSNISATAAGTTNGLSMFKMVPNTTAGRHFFQSGAASVGAQPLTVSAFVKADGYSKVAIGVSNGSGLWSVRSFDLSNGTVGSAYGAGAVPAPDAAYIIPYSNGVYRIIAIWNSIDTSASGQPVFMVTGGGDAVFEGWAGNGTDGVQYSQIQALRAVFPDGGPIIRTAGATASIGDSAMTVAYSPTDQEQLFFATGTPSDFASGGGIYENVFALFTDVSTNNAIRLRVTTAGLPSVLVSAGGVAVYNVSAAGAITENTQVTIVLLRQGGNWRGGTVIGGVLTWFGAATAGAWAAGMTSLQLGHRNGLTQVRGPEAGVFVRPGTYSTDAAVLAAVAETA